MDSVESDMWQSDVVVWCWDKRRNNGAAMERKEWYRTVLRGWCDLVTGS